MPQLVPLYIDAAAVTAVCLDTSADEASTTFKTDFFRSTGTPYADWYEVVLNFDFTSTPPSLTLTRPGNTAVLTIKLLSSDAPATDDPTPPIRVSSELLGRLESYNSSKKFSISIGDLMQADKSHPLVSLLGRSNNSSLFYQQLSDRYFDRFMDKRDREGLIRYANQRSIFTYARLFVEEVPEEPTKFLTLDPDETSQEWSIAKGRNSNSYIIKYSRPVIERNTHTNAATQLCKIHLAAPYNRVTQTLEGPLHVVLEFADDCSEKQREETTRRVIELYQHYRKRSIDSGIIDPGELSSNPKELGTSQRILAPTQLISNPIKIRTKLISALGVILLTAGIICAVLIGIGILPALPALANLSMTLGPFLLSGKILSSLVVATTALSTMALSIVTARFNQAPIIVLPKITPPGPTSVAMPLSPGMAGITVPAPAARQEPSVSSGATPGAGRSAVETPASPSSHPGH